MKADFLILVAEDDENDAFILQRALKKAGIADPVRVVVDGQQAIDYLAGMGKYQDRQQHPLPDLAIFDIKMPRKDGFDALRWTREQDHLQDLPVMMLTSSGETCDIKKAYELGANAYLIKRAEINQLSMELGKACAFWKEAVHTPAAVVAV